MPNRLAHSTSPYLLQHAHQPVDWYPWGPEALEKARRENKPIFLSIGYAACHWCHVMARESFEDPEIARLLNRHFVPIKVDREEHPEVDRVYMQAVIAMTGQGGWPLSVFLTPEGEPFYGGTYFPPEPRHGLPSFRQVLEAVIRAWQEDEAGVRASAARLREPLRLQLRGSLQSQPGRNLTPHLLEEAVEALNRDFDARHGGWGYAPKFPRATVLEFLLRQAARGHGRAREMAVHTLAAMAQGGMYDVLGGGFHRYSVDMSWWVPHFEKMLYDNALLARVYLYGYLLTAAEPLRRVVEATLAFLLREMRHPEGGFYSSLDADSEGREGAFYTWTPEEVARYLPDEERDLFLRAYGLTGPPQMEDGRYVLRRMYTDRDLAARFGLSEEEVRARLARARARLFQVRETRPRPRADDKILLGWNALAVWALAEAAFYLKRKDWLQAAREAAHFLLTRLRREGRWHRGWRQGRVTPTPAYLADHAALGLALLALYRAHPDLRWYREAEEQARLIREGFSDPEGGWADTPAGYRAPLTRPRTLEDQVIPSGNALTVTLWLHLYVYTGDSSYRREAEELLRGMASVMTYAPLGFGQWLCALDLAVGPLLEVAILGEPSAAGTQALMDVLRERWRPCSLWAVSAYPPPEDAPPLVRERPLVQGRPTAYVCRDFVCREPVTSPGALRQALEGT